jgi:TorA maturation chaperone TorD
MQPAKDLGPLYHLAARLLVRELDAAAVEALLAPDVIEVLERAEAGTAAYLRGWSPERESRAAEAFAALFLLPGGVCPRAGAWLSNPAAHSRLVSEGRRTLERLGRRQVGAKGVGRLPDDHAGLLLELCAESGEEFLVEAWLRPFAEALAEADAPPVYRALGHVLLALGSSE